MVSTTNSWAVRVPFFFQDPVFFAGQESQPEKLEKINEALGYLNLFLEGQNWVAGDSMTIADISLVVSVSNSEVSKWLSFTCQTCFPSKSLFNLLNVRDRQITLQNVLPVSKAWKCGSLLLCA
jgi:glutathione S-transferase